MAKTLTITLDVSHLDERQIASVTCNMTAQAESYWDGCNDREDYPDVPVLGAVTTES